MCRKFGVHARKDAVVETAHAFGAKGWVQRAHLVDDTAERPQVALVVIRFLLPDLGTGVVGGSCLRIKHTVLRNLTHVEIAHFENAIFTLKDVRRFQVTMENFLHVECLQTVGHLD